MFKDANVSVSCSFTNKDIVIMPLNKIKDTMFGLTKIYEWK